MSTQRMAKHNTRKTMMKGKSKKDLKELVVPLVKTPPAGGVVPPFTVFLHMRRNVMIVSVPLHRVPDKIVQFDVDAKRFLLDTTKFTRKPFHLEFTYPEGIVIDTSSVDAKIENGVFAASISLLSVPEAYKQKTGDKMDVAADKSRKRKRSAAEAAQPTGEAKPAAAKPAAKTAENGTNGSEAAQKAKKTKQPKKKQKKGPSESSEKQIDARAVTLDKAMGLIEELNAKEETQISTKLNKEKEKKAAFNAKEKQKRQKKQDKKQKIEQLVDELKKEKAEAENEKKPLKKATPRRVSFAEPGKKAANGDASPGKKAAAAGPKKSQPAKKKAAAS